MTSIKDPRDGLAIAPRSALRSLRSVEGPSLASASSTHDHAVSDDAPTLVVPETAARVAAQQASDPHDTVSEEALTIRLPGPARRRTPPPLPAAARRPAPRNGAP